MIQSHGRRVRGARVAVAVGILICCRAVTPATASSISAQDLAHISSIERDVGSLVILKGGPVERRSLSQEMARLHVPGLSIAFIRNGKIAWTRTYGVTRMGGSPVNTRTLFQAGSISKPLTGLAVLRLVEMGKLDLDTDVNHYLKTWKVPTNAFTTQRPVTIRELLTHTAGVTVHGFPGYAKGEPVPTLTQVLDGTLPANTPPIWVDTLPGTNWRYSGGGYVILQKMLEDVTGEPFSKLMRELVLAPIGMTNSTFEQPLPKDRAGEAATPYRDKWQPVVGGAHTYPEEAPAGLWTTPSDLALYMVGVQNAIAGKSNRLLSRTMAAEMVKPEKLGGWGLGPQINTDDPNRPAFTHGGGDEGFLSLFFAYDAGEGVALMTNADLGWQLINEVQVSIAREYGWATPRPKVRTIHPVASRYIQALVGTYQAPGSIGEIVRRRGEVLVHLAGQPEYRIFPESTVLWTDRDGDQIKFEKNAQGQVTTVRISGDNDQTLKRISEVEARAARRTLEDRIKRKLPSQGTEAALRTYIGAMEAGEPDYNDMTSTEADNVRQNLRSIKAQFDRYGPLKAVRFESVEPGGMDVYNVDFEGGRAKWMIAPLTSDGKLAAQIHIDMPWPGLKG